MNDLLTRAYVTVHVSVHVLKSRLHHAEEGQTLVEWGIIVGFLAIVAVFALKNLQPHVNHVITQTGVCMDSGPAGALTPPPAGVTDACAAATSQAGQ